MMNSNFRNLLIGIVIGVGFILLLDSFNPMDQFTFKELPKPYYKILFENDDVRIVEHKLEPGESEPLHSHPPMFVYFLEDAEVWVAGPDGKSRKEILKKGQTLIPPSITHSIQNKGTSALHSLLVELKE